MAMLLGLSSSHGPQGAAPQATPGPSSGIQDNSFLVEEAYNQDPGVVQHISGFMRQRSGDWAYTFTQEWPAPGVRHQLSFAVSVLGMAEGGGAGIGDLALNYRYQLVGDAEARLAVAPRVTVLMPTGDWRADRGAGAVGLQLVLPVSVVVSDRVVAHSNAGVTLVPNARNSDGERAGTTSFSLGQSLVWLTAPRFNVLVEAVWNRTQTVAGPGRTATADSIVVSPGIRWSYDFPSGLQIVPGIAVPIGVGPSAGDRAVFLYLSFEHPFGKRN
jgi:hypothetical protein